MRNVLFGLLALVTVAANAQSVPFRGENFCGIFDKEKNLMKEWPAEGPKKLWVVNDAGKGNSSVAVDGGFIYTSGLTEDEQEEQVSCYTLDGKKVYQSTFGKAWTKSFQETRCTPIIDSDRIYIISGMGELACLNKADGKILWKFEYWQRYGLVPNDQGIREQPMIDGDRVVFNACGKDVTIITLNKFTGDIIWEAPSFGDKAMYVPVRVIEYNGKRQYFGATSEHIFGVDCETGKIVWSDSQWKPEHNDWINTMINTPIFYQGYFLVSMGDGFGCTMYKLADDLSSIELLWKNQALDLYIGGMIEIDGVVYGSTGDKNLWAALDIKTGEVLYHSQWKGKARGSLIMADNMFYMFDERRGFVGLANINPKQLDVVSEFRVTDGAGACFAHPAIFDGVLYIRHGTALVAYDIKAN